MAFLTDSEKQEITRAIQTVEKTTSGELITVLASQADDYLYIPTLWAALLALALPGLLVLFDLQLATLGVFELQFVVFVVLSLVFRWPPLMIRLIPRQVRFHRAHRLAQEMFLVNRLHLTEQGTGILLFVSVAERYVEIIADEGINRKVDAAVWSRIVEDFVGQVRAGKVKEGFLQAVEKCGEILAEHFPADESNRNELPDHFVEL